MSFTPLANRVATTDGGVTAVYNSAANGVKGITVFTVGATSAPTDSLGNVYVKRTQRTNSVEGAIWDCFNPTLSTAHVITVHGGAAVAIAEFWKVDGSSAVEQIPTPHDFGGAAGAGIGFNDFTPGVDGCWVIGAHGSISVGQPAAYAGANGFTALGSQIYNGGGNFGAGMVSQLQNVAALVAAATNYATWGAAASGVKLAIVYKEVAAASITYDEKQQGYIVQRANGTGTIQISGTSTATTGIEARVVLNGTGTEVLGWTQIKGAHAGGAFNAPLPGIPEGGWYNIQLRQASDHSIVANGANRLGVGALIVPAGQSLAQKLSTDGNSVAPHALLSEYTTGGGWALRGNTGSGANTLGNQIIAALGGNIPVAIVNTGIGGTSLIQAGDTQGNGYWLNQAGGSPYALWLAVITAIGGKVEAIYWEQGQQDGYSGLVDSATYLAGLTTLFARMRTALGQPTVPIIVSTLARYTSLPVDDDRWEGIRRAQIAAGLAANNVLAAFNHDLTLADGVHLDEASAIKQGIRGARAYRAAKGLSTYARGPEIASAVRVTSTLVEVILSHRGGTDFTPGSAITGLSIVGGAAPAISSAVRTNATKISLNLASPLTGGESIRHMYGAAPSIAGAVHDNSAEALPLGLESGSSLLITVPDTDAPDPANAAAHATSTTTASWSVDVNEATGTLYYYASANAVETVGVVKASGQTVNVTSTGTKTGSVAGLPPGAGRYVHFVHRDAAGNDSIVVSSPLFMTPALPRATVELFAEDGATPIADQAGVVCAWYPSFPPNFATAADVTVTGAIAGGVLDISLAGTSQQVGDRGTLVLVKGDGTPFSDDNYALIVPWDINA